MFVVKVPGLNISEESKVKKHCRNAGREIIKGLNKIHTSEEGDIIDKENLDLEEIHVNNKDLEEQQDLIKENSLNAFQNKDKAIFLGGDHSITYNIGKSFLSSFDEPCLIVFDSYADCLQSKDFPDNYSWLRSLIEEGFPGERVMLVGARNIRSENNKFLVENNVKRIRMNDLHNNLEEVTDKIMEFSNKNQLYLSFDLGVLDPAFIPNGFDLEPGGISSRELLYVISRLRVLKNLKSLDIVETNPKDPRSLSLASKILAEFL